MGGCCMAKLKPVSLGGIEFDALVDMTENYTSEVPSYAVDTGYEVSDNISIKPLTIELSAYITNTPVTWIKRKGHKPSKKRTNKIVSKLKKLYFKRSLVNLKTTTGTYKNMAITSLSIPKDTENYTSREIKISLQQITKVSAQTTSIPASYVTGGDTGADAGTASTSTSSSSSSSGSSGSSSSSSNSKSDSGGKASILYNLVN